MSATRESSLLVQLLRPPALVIKWVFDRLYAICCGWWLDDLLVKKSNSDFASDILKHVSFLFSQYDAQILPNDRNPPASFDWAMVTISVRNLILTFFRDRGTVTVRVSARNAANESFELMTLLSAIDASDLPRVPFSHLIEVERVLSRSIDKLEIALAADKYNVSKEGVDAISQQDEVVRRQWEREINRRLGR